MKFLVDFFPILLFFIVFKFYGIYVATGAAILASLATLAYSYFYTKKVESLQWITLIIIVILGGATLFFHNELFIKWKPTAVEWIFALVFLGSQYFGEKNLTERMLGKEVHLSANIWRNLNVSWVLFFTAMGAANIYVLLNYSTNIWVNFKMFGLLGFTTLFVIGQTYYISKHTDHV